MIARYFVVAASLAGGCFCLYAHEFKIGAGLIGFAGLLTDPADVMALLEKVAAWALAWKHPGT